MNNFWKNIAKTSAIYMIGTVLAKLVSFLMLPLYTHNISAEAYGKYDIIIAYAAIIVPLAAVNCWQGMLRFLIEVQDENRKKELISNGFLMMVLGFGILSLGYLAFCALIPISNPVLVYLYMLFFMLNNFFLFVSRGLRQNSVYALSGIISSVVVAAVSMVCVFGFHLQIEALYLSQIFSFAAQIVFIELRLHVLRYVNFHMVGKEKLHTLYRYCFPDSVSSIFNWLLSSVNRMVIVAVLGYAANGVYAISNKFLNILNVFMTAFILAFQEGLYSSEPEQMQLNANDGIQKFCSVAGWGVSIVLLGTNVVYPLFVAGEYQEGYTLIPLFYLYFLISSLTWLMSSVVSATKEMKILLYEKMIIGTVNLVLISLLIKPIGLSSSPIALIISEFLGAFLFIGMLKKYTDVELKVPLRGLPRDILLLGISVIIFLMNKPWLSILAILVLMGLYLLLYREQVKTLLAAVTKRGNKN